MTEIKIMVTLKIADSIWKPDMVDQVAEAVQKSISYEPSGLIEFVSAESVE